MLNTYNLVAYQNVLYIKDFNLVFDLYFLVNYTSIIKQNQIMVC